MQNLHFYHLQNQSVGGDYLKRGHEDFLGQIERNGVID